MHGGGQSREATTANAVAGRAVPSTCPSCPATSGPSLSVLLATFTTVGLREESGRRRLKGQGPSGRGPSNRVLGKRSGKGPSRESPALSGPFIGAEVSVVAPMQTAVGGGVYAETKGGTNRVPGLSIAENLAFGATIQKRLGRDGRPSMSANDAVGAAFGGRRAASTKRGGARSATPTAVTTINGTARLAAPYGLISRRARQRQVISL